MFIDYYAVLEINISASQQEIKTAFKKQALEWHPDRNLRQDTTLTMQEINEAYLILKDPEARERYDREYNKFQAQHKEQQESSKRKQSEERDKKKPEREYQYSEYIFNDDILSKWIENARKQSVDLARITIEDFKSTSTAGAETTASAIIVGFGKYLIYSMIILVMFIMIKTCN